MFWRHINFSRWRLGDVCRLGRSKAICRPNFDNQSINHSLSTAEILFPVYKQPPWCWNFSASLACVDLPNFIRDEPSETELWCHIDFPRWWPQCRKSTSGFQFDDIVHLRGPKTICILNVLIYTDEIFYFRFTKTNGHHIEILLPVLMRFHRYRHSAVPNVIRSTVMTLWRHSDFQNGLEFTITWKRYKTGHQLVLFTNMNSHTSFRLEPESVTLSDLIGAPQWPSSRVISHNAAAFRVNCVTFICTVDAVSISSQEV